ncbi:PIN domain-containing protein [Nostoc sp. C110]|uniref:PIN domain-containing protein n=1 Tax=Nostoc sp. C110 TaxID=3349876 RepID=UPI00370D5C35
MKFRVVIDTNIWIRILLKGRVTLPIFEAFNEDKFQLVMSQPLMEELHLVWNRPRLREQINQVLLFNLNSSCSTEQYGLSWKRFHLIVEIPKI